MLLTQAFGFGPFIEMVIASKADFILCILTSLKSLTTVELALLVSVFDVQMIANRSVITFKIDAKNRAVSQLAMSAAGEVWSLEPL